VRRTGPRRVSKNLADLLLYQLSFTMSTGMRALRQCTRVVTRAPLTASLRTTPLFSRSLLRPLPTGARCMSTTASESEPAKADAPAPASDDLEAKLKAKDEEIADLTVSSFSLRRRASSMSTFTHIPYRAGYATHRRTSSTSSALLPAKRSNNATLPFRASRPTCSRRPTCSPLPCAPFNQQARLQTR